MARWRQELVRTGSNGTLYKLIQSSENASTNQARKIDICVCKHSIKYKASELMLITRTVFLSSNTTLTGFQTLQNNINNLRSRKNNFLVKYEFTTMREQSGTCQFYLQRNTYNVVTHHAHSKWSGVLRDVFLWNKNEQSKWTEQSSALHLLVQQRQDRVKGHALECCRILFCNLSNDVTYGAGFLFRSLD